MMLPAVVLLLSICMQLESCAGRHAISDQNQKGRAMKVAVGLIVL